MRFSIEITSSDDDGDTILDIVDDFAEMGFDCETDANNPHDFIGALIFNNETIDSAFPPKSVLEEIQDTIDTYYPGKTFLVYIKVSD
jgi:hypothetical protein